MSHHSLRGDGMPLGRHRRDAPIRYHIITSRHDAHRSALRSLHSSLLPLFCGSPRRARRGTAVGIAATREDLGARIRAAAGHRAVPAAAAVPRGGPEPTPGVEPFVVVVVVTRGVVQRGESRCETPAEEGTTARGRGTARERLPTLRRGRCLHREHPVVVESALTSAFSPAKVRDSIRVPLLRSFPSIQEGAATD